MHTNHTLPNQPTLFVEPQPLLPVLIVALLGLVAIALSDFLADRAAQWGLLAGGLLLQVSAGVAWGLRTRWPHLGYWLVSLTLSGVALAGARWSQSPLPLFFLPAAVLVMRSQPGTSGVLVVASLTTVALLVPPVHPPQVAALVALWALLGLVDGLVRPLQQTTTWAWQQYALARHALDTERDYKADLQQALHALLEANRQLDLLNERLIAMRQMAEAAHQAKATFVAKVSHEFRTPLNMIIGLIDLVVQTPDLYGPTLAPALLADLAIVQRNCTHLASMIDDVLDLSQTQAGRLALHREWVDLGQEVRHAVSVVQPLVAKKGLTLQVDLAEAVPAIYCDRTRIRQVILNLVSNAARYTERGAITIQARLNEQGVCLAVSDTGPGIAPSDLTLIFEPFYQATNGPWQERKGSGLGLSICRQLVELHHGTLTVESTLGQGSTFAFCLPLTPPGSPPARAGRWLQEDWLWHEHPHSRPATLPPALPHQRRVVLYDASGELYPLLAADDGLDLVDAPSLDDALTAVAQLPAHALLINQPDPTALWSLIATAKARTPDTPIIGYTLPARGEPMAQAGAAHYLTKPVTRADLKSLLQAGEQPTRRVLLVDDDPEFRSLLARLLQALDPGLTITGTADPAAALHHLADDPPDLLILDLNMPQLDGWQLLQRKATIPAAQGTRVAIVSAQDPSGEPPSGDLLVAALGRRLPCEQLIQTALMVAQRFLLPPSPVDPASPTGLGAPPA